MKNLTVVLTVSLFSSIIVYSQISEYKILPADGSNNDAFGNSVSISGDYAIVGAPGDDENSHFSGSAYIFRRDGETWIEEQKLLATDITRGDQFGYSVSISGYNAIVGAARDDDNGLNSGSAYFFRRDSTSWVEEKKIIASDGAEGDLFGSSVSISEDFAIIGAQRNDPRCPEVDHYRNAAALDVSREARIGQVNRSPGEQRAFAASTAGMFLEAAIRNPVDRVAARAGDMMIIVHGSGGLSLSIHRKWGKAAGIQGSCGGRPVTPGVASRRFKQRGHGKFECRSFFRAAP